MIFQSLKTLRRLLRQQYLEPEALRILQHQKLFRIIRHAYEFVPYYRALFDETDIVPNDITGPEELVRIPLLTKEALKSLKPHELLNRKLSLENCHPKSTSGSTGKPLQIWFHEEELATQTLVNLRIMLAAGFRFTDTTVYIKNPKRFPSSKYWFQSLGILRREYLSAFHTPEAHTDALRQMRSDMIYSYPSVLQLITHQLRRQGLNDLRPKAVFSTAEMLEPFVREQIATTLHTKVYDVVGLIELGDIAWECPMHAGYHLNVDTVLIEFLDSDDKPVPPGQPGRLVCTGLDNYAMPLIRYDTGDIGVPSQHLCSCGRTLPLMERVQGRTNDFIILPDGGQVSPSFSHVIIQNFQDVDRYAIIQQHDGTVVVNIVPGEGFTEARERKLQQEIEQAVFQAIPVRLELVSDIPRNSSGKIRTVTSHVPRA